MQQNNELKTPYDWARHYVDLGLCVLPVAQFDPNWNWELRKTKKFPSFDGKPMEWKQLGFQNRLPTEAELKDWFITRKNTRMGIVTGKVSGVTVIDVDPRNRGTTEGLQSQITVSTPSPGWHFYYKYDPTIPSGKPREGIDLQNDGRFIVLPPSLHWKSEVNNLVRYEWGMLDFNRDLLDNPPDWTREAMFKNSNFSLADTLSKEIGEGGRDNTLTQIAGSMISRMPKETWETEVLPFLYFLNKEKCKPPLPMADVQRIFNSIINKHQRNHKEEEKKDIIIRPLHKIVDDLPPESQNRIKTGITTLDNWTRGGLAEGHLWVLAGPPASGKTLFAQTITRNIVKQKIPTMWFSYELSHQELQERFKQINCDDNDLILSPQEYNQDDVEWIEQAIKITKSQIDLKVVFIDHLSFLSPKPNKQMPEQNFATYLHAVSRQLKNVARENNLAIVLLQHTNMSSEGKLSKHDLADSKSTAKECDVLLFIKKLLKEDLLGIEKVENPFLKERKDRLIVDISKQSVEETTGLGLITVDKVRVIKGKEGSFTIKLAKDNSFIDYLDNGFYEEDSKLQEIAEAFGGEVINY